MYFFNVLALGPNIIFNWLSISTIPLAPNLWIPSLSTKDIYRSLNSNEKNKYFVVDEKGVPKYIRGINSKDKQELQKICL